MKNILLILIVTIILAACATLPASPQPGEATAYVAYLLATETAPVPRTTPEPSPVGERELIPLLLAVNQAREVSASIVAELMETKNNSEINGDDGETGESLMAKLEENHLLVVSTDKEIEARPFASEEVSNQYREIEDFYQQLILFENYVIDNLSQIENAEEFSGFINRIFETDNAWPELIAADENFRNLLSDLASRHTLEIEDKSYDEIFRDRLGELRAPAAPELSDQLGQVIYEFEVPKQFSQTTVSASWTGAPIDVFQFALQHPDGRTIHFNLAPLNEKESIYDIPIYNLPIDGSVVSIPSEKYPARENFSGGATIGYDQGFLMIKLVPDDPILAPMEGKWTLTIRAPAGLEVILGDVTIP